MAFPPDTTYASVTDLKARVALSSTASDGYLQQLLNDGAWMVDSLTRGAKEGYEAFSVSGSESRVFDDDLTDSIEIDDLVGAPTLVQRGTVTIASTYYKTWPYNPGKGPYTRIMFRLDALINATQVATSLWYGHPHRGVGAGMITVTGTWGYCDNSVVGARPATVKEATLQLATLAYKQTSLTTAEILQAVVSDPTKFLSKQVYDRLMVLRRERALFFV